MKKLLQAGAWCFASLLGLGGAASAQIADQVIVFGQNNWVFRFNRRLDLLGTTALPGSGSTAPNTQLGIDSHGTAWIPYDPLSVKDVVRVEPDGTLLPITTIDYNPLFFVPSIDGRVFGITRIPLSAPGPAYGFGPDATVLWVNAQGPNMDTLSYPQKLVMTAAGALWIGTTTPQAGKFFARTLLIRISPQDGSVLSTYWPPDLTANSGDEVLPDFVATIDGSMWMSRGGPADGPVWTTLEHTNAHDILQSIPLTSAGNNGQCHSVRVDGAGELYVVSGNDTAGQGGKLLYRFDPAAPSAPQATYTMGGLVTGFSLGANGDEAYATVAPPSAPLTRRLERVNLATGRKSSRSMDAWIAPNIPQGDPTGYIYANTIDRDGDNDGDGIANGVETAARSNPFDPLSRPDGPKVFIDFAPTGNSPILIFQDPDGLLNPTKGLDLSSLSLKVGAYGEVFQFILPFLTSVELTPDGTQATATFAALHLANNAKLKFEARVTDLTGAVGWDFQVSPPGDL